MAVNLRAPLHAAAKRSAPTRSGARNHDEARMSVAEQTGVLLDRLRAGDEQAVGELFELYRERLWRMLYVRLDRRLGRRVSPEDVLQEAFIDVARRVGE